MYVRALTCSVGANASRTYALTETMTMSQGPIDAAEVSALQSTSKLSMALAVTRSFEVAQSWSKCAPARMRKRTS